MYATYRNHFLAGRILQIMRRLVAVSQDSHGEQCTQGSHLCIGDQNNRNFFRNMGIRSSAASVGHQ